MAQFEPLAGAGKDDVVIADRVAAAQRGKPDIAAAARPGDAVATALRDRVERDPAPARRGAGAMIALRSTRTAVARIDRDRISVRRCLERLDLAAETDDHPYEVRSIGMGFRECL